jgi:hypothetical protein
MKHKLRMMSLMQDREKPDTKMRNMTMLFEPESPFAHGKTRKELYLQTGVGDLPTPTQLIKSRPPRHLMVPLIPLSLVGVGLRFML